ncbi:outer-membrane lipoprotein carrier protein [Alphaproteobacteria bacterium]|nr:outer-membrane lipoprotein carrier protein [Alphaproteobacteria bacterium]
MRFLAFLAVLCLMGTGASALTENQNQLLTRVEDAFSEVRTMTADFSQSASSGDTATGKLYLAKPGRLKMQYDPPSSFEILANGKNFIYYDKAADQTTHIDISQTTANLILRDRLSFRDPGLRVESVREKGGVAEISVSQTDDSLAGSITLVFAMTPVRLIGWRITDAQGITTQVELANQRSNVAVADAMFRYINPRLKTKLPGD